MSSESALDRVDPNLGRWVLASTILASSMAFIDGSALNVALPAVQTALNASGALLLWVVNGYLLMLAALILVGGSLGDELGRKRVFMLGIALFMFASLLCGLAPTIEFLVAARVLEGIGGALMIPGSLAIISAFFPAGERGRAIGTWSAVTTIVTLAGPVLGGFLANAGLWRGVFLINLPVGLTALVVLYSKVPESRGDHAGGKIDWVGALLAVVGLAGLTYGILSAPDDGFQSPNVFASLAVGSAALVAFVIVEAQSAHPMMPLGLFRSHTFSGTNLLTLFLYGALNVGPFFLSLNLVQVQGYNLAVAGFAFTPFVFILTALSRWAGGLTDRYGARLPLVIGPALAGLGFLLMSFAGLTAGVTQYWTTFFPGIATLGIGMGITVAPLSTGVMNAVATDLAGTASGINNAVARTAGALAIAIVGAIALVVFANALQVRTSAVDLSSGTRTALEAEASKLGAAAVPAATNPASAPAVASAIKMAFVDTFNFVMVVCAALAWLGALIAGFLVDGKVVAAPRVAGAIGEG
jgi:EmrB/QacA subfamily drug resistance transporter